MVSLKEKFSMKMKILGLMIKELDFVSIGFSLVDLGLVVNLDLFLLGIEGSLLILLGESE